MQKGANGVDVQFFDSCVMLAAPGVPAISPMLEKSTFPTLDSNRLPPGVLGRYLKNDRSDVKR